MNDNAPQFSAPVYSVLIAENNEGGRFVADVSANDFDADENAQITYTIVQNAASPYSSSLTIDSQTGRVYAQRQFDRELASKVGLLIRASDAGSPPKTSTAFLEINIDGKLSVLLFIMCVCRIESAQSIYRMIKSSFY